MDRINKIYRMGRIEMSVLKDLLTSKKFLAALLALIMGFGSKFVPELANLDTTELATLLSPLLAYIVAQGVADQGKGTALVTAAKEVLDKQREG